MDYPRRSRTDFLELLSLHLSLQKMPFGFAPVETLAAAGERAGFGNHPVGGQTDVIIIVPVSAEDINLLNIVARRPLM